MKSPIQPLISHTVIALCLFIALLAPSAACMAADSEEYAIGETKLKLKGPAEHSRFGKKSIPALLLVPDRYKGLVNHTLAFFSREGVNKPSKMYNNHGAIFYMGSSKKVWSREDFARIRSRLMPGIKAKNAAQLHDNEQFMRSFLAEDADFTISQRKAKKYYSRLQQSTVLLDTENAIALAYRHKKKGERDKYVTVSLSLVGNKVIGTAYYQVDPGSKERNRAAQMTLDWQKSILDANK